MKKSTKIILVIVGIIAVIGIEELILLPLNLQAFSTWFILLFAGIVAALLLGSRTVVTSKGIDIVGTGSYRPIKIMGVVLVGFILVEVIAGPIFSAGFYARRTVINEGDFSKDVEEVDVKNIALVDKQSAQKLGDRVMGDLPELVSQFDVSDEYNQITYQGHLYRVTPLEYNGFFKWMGNNNTGTPGYILVDSSTGEARLQRVEGGMHYVPSSYLVTDLRRHIFNAYPTELLCDSVFEIDEEGNPYWITPVKKVRAVALATDIKGVIITSAVDGTNTYYEVGDTPEWVDHVYPSEVIEDQIDSVLKYQEGYINTVFAQSGVRKLTPAFEYSMGGDETVEYTGYQYIGCNGGKDVCLYSGVTSAAADDSNLGFVLANLRTGKVDYYAAAGAEEYSAIDTARGATQEKNYTASFPILVSLDQRPTYILSLKDAAGLVKAYAFVDVQNYQKVSVTSSDQGIEAAVSAYRSMMGLYTPDESEPLETTKMDLVVKEVHTAVVDGNSMYYILSTDDKVYMASIQASTKLPFVKAEDTLHCEVTKQNVITTIE